jgi:hypothetical protein
MEVRFVPTSDIEDAASVGMSQTCHQRMLVIRTNDLTELPPLDGVA